MCRVPVAVPLLVCFGIAPLLGWWMMESILGLLVGLFGGLGCFLITIHISEAGLGTAPSIALLVSALVAEAAAVWLSWT
jgi:hypothetical protein